MEKLANTVLNKQSGWKLEKHDKTNSQDGIIGNTHNKTVGMGKGHT
jgi:hypothetical protein